MPVVATDAGGTRTVVDDGETGSLRRSATSPARRAPRSSSQRPGAARDSGRRGRGRCASGSHVARMVGRRSTRLHEAPRAVKVLHIHKITGRRRGRSSTCSRCCRHCASAASTHASSRSTSGRRRAALLRRARRARRPVARAFAAGSTSSPAWRAAVVRAVRDERPDLLHTHLVHARRLRLARGDDAASAVRLLSAQRRPLPARAVSPRRPAFAHARRATAHRDLGRRPRLPRPRGPAGESS